MGRTRQFIFAAGGLVAIAGGLLFWFCYVEPIRSHMRWYPRIRQDVYSLARKRPPEVSKGQWEFVVGWTLNLHANCGSFRAAVEPEWRDGFAAEFERRLAGPLTVADIDWVWDEYARHTTSGQTYSDRWRPTRADEFPQAHEGCFGIPVD